MTKLNTPRPVKNREKVTRFLTKKFLFKTLKKKQDRVPRHSRVRTFRRRHVDRHGR